MNQENPTPSAQNQDRYSHKRIVAKRVGTVAAGVALAGGIVAGAAAAYENAHVAGQAEAAPHSSNLDYLRSKDRNSEIGGRAANMAAAILADAKAHPERVTIEHSAENGDPGAPTFDMLSDTITTPASATAPAGTQVFRVAVQPDGEGGYKPDTKHQVIDIDGDYTALSDDGTATQYYDYTDRLFKTNDPSDDSVTDYWSTGFTVNTDQGQGSGASVDYGAARQPGMTPDTLRGIDQQILVEAATRLHDAGL